MIDGSFHEVPDAVAPGDPPTAEHDTPNLLLDAAESLIAEEGIDAVSIRAVNASAGRNPAAVHYHFGPKEALVAAVLRRRMPAIGAQRAVLLAPLEREARPTARRLAEAMILPLAHIRESQPWGPTYVRFLATLLNGGAHWRTLASEVFEPEDVVMQRVMARTLVDVPQPARRFRGELVARLVSATLAELDVVATYWADGTGHTDGRGGADDPTTSALTALVGAATAIFSAPVE